MICCCIRAHTDSMLIVGKCYPIQTLKALLHFCSKHSIHLISDEIYALTVFDSGEPTATPFTSVLSIDFDGIIDPNLVHVMYGLSKVRPQVSPP